MMAHGRIKLLGVVGFSSAMLLPHFVRHYRAFGVEEFLLSLHMGSREADECATLLQTLTALDAYPKRKWSGAFSHDRKAEELDALRTEFTGDRDWLVYADADEFHEFLLPLPAWRDACRRHGVRYAMGRWIDRVADKGALPPITPVPDIFAQFPWGTHLSVTLGGKSFDATTKLCFMDAGIAPSNPGFHRPAGRDWRQDPERWPGLIACHHFKWDATVRERLAVRPGSWDVPNSIREADSIMAHIREHAGRIALEQICPRVRVGDDSPWRRQALRWSRFTACRLRSRLAARPAPAAGGLDISLATPHGIYH